MNMRWLVALAVGPAFAGAVAAADLWKKAPAGADELLPAETAFQLVSAQREGSFVKLEWVIAPGYYLYRQRLAFEALPPATAKLGKAQLPAGTKLHDEHFGDVEIYRASLKAKLPLSSRKAALSQLRVRFQGCADAGVCYPPITRIVDVASAAAVAASK